MKKIIKALMFVFGVFAVSTMLLYTFIFAAIQQSEHYKPLTENEVSEVRK